MDQSRLKLVADVMSKDVILINGKKTVREAVQTMKLNKVNSLIVERLDDHEEIGLITLADVASEIVAKNRSLDRVHILEIMSKPVLSLPPNMTLHNASRLLSRFDISRAVVIDEHRHPVGMITRGDIVYGCLDDE